MSGDSENPRFGGRRVGLIVPSVNATIEPEYAWIAPPGLSFHAVRVLLRTTTAAGLKAMNEELDGAARLLASLAPDLVAYACTSGSFLEGEAAARAQRERIEEIAGCPVVTTSTAMIEALAALGLRRIALATPYLDEVNLAERRFFEENGIEVVRLQGLGLSGPAIREVSPARVARLVRETDHPEAEAIFVSCTDLRALEVVDELEAALGKPVLTSNQVTLWAILRALGRPTALARLGRLLGA